MDDVIRIHDGKRPSRRSAIGDARDVIGAPSERRGSDVYSITSLVRARIDGGIVRARSEKEAVVGHLSELSMAATAVTPTTATGVVATHSFISTNTKGQTPECGRRIPSATLASGQDQHHGKPDDADAKIDGNGLSCTADWIARQIKRGLHGLLIGRAPSLRGQPAICAIDEEGGLRAVYSEADALTGRNRRKVGANLLDRIA